MKTRLWCAAATLAPSALGAPAPAALSLRIGPNSGAVIDWSFDVPFPTGTRYIDLVLIETGTAENEALSTYDIGVTLRSETPGGGAGIRIVQPTTLAQRNALAQGNDPVANPFVFEGASVTVTPPPAGQENTRIQINFDNAGEPADVGNNMSAGRIPFEILPGFRPGRYYFEFDPDNTVFASSEALPIAVDITDRGVFEPIPEPSAACSLLALGLLALRRAGRREAA